MVKPLLLHASYREQGLIWHQSTHREKIIGRMCLVVGGRDTAVDTALDLLDLAEEITIIHRRDRFRALDDNVRKMEESKKLTYCLILSSRK